MGGAGREKNGWWLPCQRRGKKRGYFRIDIRIKGPMAREKSGE